MFEDEQRDEEIEEKIEDEISEPETVDDSADSVLEELTGVGDLDLKVYSLVLTMGNITKGDLLLLLKGVDFTAVEGSLTNLKQKQMVIELPGIIPRYKAVPPFDGLSKEVADISEKIGSLRDELKEQIRTASVTVRNALVDLTRQNLTSIEAQESEVSSRKNEAASSIQSSMQTMRESTESSASGFDSSVQTTCDEWKNEIGSKVDESIVGIQTHLASTSDSLTSSVQEFMTDVKGKTEHHRSELELKITSFETSSKFNADKQTANVSDVLTKHKELIASVVGDSVNTLNGALQQSSTNTVSSIKSTFEEMSSSLTETHESFGRHIETASKNIEEQYDSLNSEFGTAVGSLKESHEKIMNEYTKSHEQELAKLAEKEDGATTGFKSGITESMAEFKTASDSIISSLSDHVSAFERQSHTSLASAQQSMKNVSVTALDASYQTVTDTSTQTIEELQGIIGRKKESVKSALTQIATRASQEISETINREIANLESELDRFHQDVSGNQEVMVDKIDQGRRESIGNLESSIGEIAERASSSVTSAANESNELIASLNTQLTDAIDRGRTKSISYADDLAGATRVAVNTLGESSRSMVISVNSQAESSGERILSEVDAAVSTGIQDTRVMSKQVNDDMDGAIESTRVSLDAKSSEISNSSKTAYTQAIEEINKSSEIAVSGIVTNIDDVRGKTADALRDLSFTISEQSSLLRSKSIALIENFDSSLDESITSWTMKIDTSTSTAKTDADSLSKQLKESISTLANDLKEKSVVLVKDERTRSLQSFEEIGNTVGQTMGTSYESLEEKIATLKSTLNGMLNKLEASPMLGLTESTLEESFASSAMGTIESQDISGMLSSVWAQVSETDFPGAKKTWTVVTRKAVAVQVIDMIGRAKSKVTLIVPNPDDIPTDVLKEVKSTIGVEVVVTEGSGLSQKAGPLIGKGNIRVRSRTERDVFACVRDAEEVLIAPAATDDVDVIGIVSEDDGFIKFIMSVVGPIFQAKARLLKPGDM